MKSCFKAVFAVVLFGAIIFIAEVEAGGRWKHGGQGKGGGMWGNMTCLGEPLNKTALRKGAKECKVEMQGSVVDDKEDGKGKKGKGRRGKKMMCMKVCKWKKQGILNADGDYDSAGAAEFIKSAFPAKAVEVVSAAMANCASQIGDSASRMDDRCAGYAKFKQCTMQDVYGTACGNGEAMKKRKAFRRNGRKGKKGQGNKGNNQEKQRNKGNNQEKQDNKGNNQEGQDAGDPLDSNMLNGLE